MRITAWKGQEALLSKPITLSARFIVEEEHFACRTMSKRPYLTISTQQVNC